MKEFVEKLIERLEAEQKYQYEKAEEADKKINLELIKVSEARRKNGQCFDVAIQVVEQLAEKYNNGWIPCSERLPEEKENPITFDYMQYPVMVNIGGKTDVRYYYFGNGHWRLGFQIMDEYVTHWMDIKHYQQK